jgi:hypothetical protein
MTSSLVARFRQLCTFFLFLFAVTLAAQAQTGLYIEYSGSKIDSPSNDWIYGPTFGAYTDLIGGVPFVHLGADLRGSVLGISQTTTLYSGLIGPRVSLHPHVLPFMPYLEGLGGVGYYDFGSGQDTSTKFEYQFLAGVDFTVFPRVDWRVIEFSYGGLSVFNGDLHPKTLSTGLVLRLP